MREINKDWDQMFRTVKKACSSSNGSSSTCEQWLRGEIATIMRGAALSCLSERLLELASTIMSPSSNSCAAILWSLYRIMEMRNSNSSNTAVIESILQKKPLSEDMILIMKTLDLKVEDYLWQVHEFMRTEIHDVASAEKRPETLLLKL